MILRKCTVCGCEATVESELALFVKNKTSKYGRANHCNKCRYNYLRQRLRQSAELRQKRKVQAKRNYRKHRRERLEYYQAYKQENLTKIRAREKSRRLPKTAVCEKCGRTDARLEKHHPDYSRPTDYVTLCALCHRPLHIEIKIPK